MSLVTLRLQPGIVRCPPDCAWEMQGRFASGWIDECPRRRCERGNRNCEPIEDIVNRTLAVVWRHQPPPPPSPLSSPRLLLITITFPHKLQMLKLEHCVRVLRYVRNFVWYVVEDAAAPSAAVAALLRRSRVPHRHAAHGPTRDGGNAQRNEAMRLIRREWSEGIVYNMDDDNSYHPELWDALRELRPMRVGVLAVRRGVYPPHGCDGTFDALDGTSWKAREHMVERPTYDAATGEFGGFEAGWCDPGSWLWKHRGPRAFCVDMGGFAFDAGLLHRLAEPLWNYSGHGGESEFIQRLIPSAAPEDLQPLANCGQDVFVFHNEYRSVPVPIRFPRASCAADGWGFTARGARRRLPRHEWPSVYGRPPYKAALARAAAEKAAGKLARQNRSSGRRGPSLGPRRRANKAIKRGIDLWR